MARASLPPIVAEGTEPPSPCVRDCCLDEQDVCLGCGRHVDEILRWRQSTASEREAILANALRRREERRRARGG